MPGVDLFRETVVSQPDTRTAKEVEQELVAKIKAIINASTEDDSGDS
jgi:hypothetical protein